MKLFEKNSKKWRWEKYLDKKESIVVEEVTLRCPRCKATFDSEDQMNTHLLGCGCGKLPIMWF